MLTWSTISTSYSEWLVTKGQRASYMYFISYRWDPWVKQFALALHERLSKQSIGEHHAPVIGFLDVARLENGHSLYDFEDALLDSQVVIPLLALHFQLFIVVVDELAVDALHQLVVVAGGIFGHGDRDGDGKEGSRESVGVKPRDRERPPAPRI